VAAALKALTRNWKLKLLAFALALLLWIVVSAEQVTSNWIPVPLEVYVADPSYRLVEGAAPREVEVRFAGPGRELWDLVIRRPPLRLTVTDVQRTTEVFPLDPRLVRLPTQLSVTAQDVRPPSVRLEFIRVATRAVPVRVPIAEGLPNGLTLVGGLQVRPTQIQVSGPAQRLGEIESITTRPLDLSAVDTSFTLQLDVDTTRLRGLDLATRQVRVSGEVDRVAERRFAPVPVDIGGGIDLRPREVEVRVVGPRSVIQQMTPDAFRVVVSIDSIPTRIPPEGIPVPLRVERLPEGVQAEVTPRTAQLFPVRPVGVPAEPAAAAPADTVPAGSR
jgi:YbbR domain-containing protein